MEELLRYADGHERDGAAMKVREQLLNRYGGMDEDRVLEDRQEDELLRAVRAEEEAIDEEKGEKAEQVGATALSLAAPWPRGLPRHRPSPSLPPRASLLTAPW